LIIPWPATNEQLVGLQLKTPTAAAAARAQRRDRLVGIVTLAGAVAMFAVGITLVTNRGWLLALQVQGSDLVLLTVLGAILILSAPGTIALARPGAAIRLRRTVFAAMIFAACLELLIAGFLTLGTIGVADMDVSGQLSPSFVNWWVLEWGLSYACTPALIISTILFRNRPNSADQ
jgi:hypothetical protein